MISDDEHQKPHIMPVWSIKNRASKVRDEDFEECEIIEIEGKVFGEWLDKLRDDDKAVAIDLKPGVVGTVVSAQKLSNEITFNLLIMTTVVNGKLILKNYFPLIHYRCFIIYKCKAPSAPENAPFSI